MLVKEISRKFQNENQEYSIFKLCVAATVLFSWAHRPVCWNQDPTRWLDLEIMSDVMMAKLIS